MIDRPAVTRDDDVDAIVAAYVAGGPSERAALWRALDQIKAARASSQSERAET